MAVRKEKSTEKKLEQQKEFYENVLNILPTDVAVFDAQHRYLYVNPAAIKNDTYRKYIIGKDDFEYCEYRRRDKSVAQARRAKFQQAVKSGNAVEWEDNMKDPKGNLVTHYRKMVPVYDKKGKLNMVVGLGIDFTGLKKAEKKLQESHEQLRNLSSHLRNIREEERIRIAREIHDELGQQLTTLKMDTSLLKKRIPAYNKKAHDKIAMMISMLDNTVKTVRRIATELRPNILDDVGLVEALAWQSREFQSRTGVKCKFRSPADKTKINKRLSTEIFRIYQEALTNVSRHAEATLISASFEINPGNIVLKIKDNGNGFIESEVTDKNTLGLLGMKERAAMLNGKLIINSIRGKGTTILLQLPFKNLKTDN
jgi:signal transduction histidine kinase